MKIIRFKNLKFQPASHEDSFKPGVFKKVLLTYKDLLSGRVQMINWARLPVGSEFAAHYHEDMEEIFIIVSGRALIKVGNKEEIKPTSDKIK